MRECAPIALVLAAALSSVVVAGARPVHALPPPSAAVSPAGIAKARWIEHRVIPGDRIAEIAERYGVRAEQIIEWNELDSDHPMIRAGQMLRLWSRANEVDREKVRYKVRRGDSWSKIARRHGVDSHRLRAYWNRGKDGNLRAGDTVIVWLEHEAPRLPRRDPARKNDSAADASTSTASTSIEPSDGSAEHPDTDPIASLIRPLPSASQSVGSPGHGRLIGALRLPDNPALYTVRKPENSYGSSHTIDTLQRAIATFRQRTGFDRELVIADMSRKHGGRFRPHHSHRSGRDVDIRLPLAEGVEKGTVPLQMSQVDWDAAWSLMRTLMDSGQVEYIFLSRSRQKALYAAARRAGLSEQELEALIQYPDNGRTAVVRHSHGHVKHFHVRFRCASDESRCRER